MQLYFFETLKLKKKKKKEALLFDLRKLAVQCLLFKPELLSRSVSFSLMWCCGSWLHSIQCNLSNTQRCDVVDKLQWSELLLVCDSSLFALTVLNMGTLSLAIST